MALEYCCDCDEPTGNAGIMDDSLFIEGAGPYCDKCYKTNLYKSQRDRLLDATKNIISISDRKHDFYDTAKAIIQEIEQESKE